MIFKTVDDKHIFNSINRLERGKSSGPDIVTATADVKDAVHSITGPRRMIYNSSLNISLAGYLEENQGQPNFQKWLNENINSI